MKDKTQIQQEVNRTLDSLDGLQKAVANPFLFTRVLARLQQDEFSIWSRAVSFMSRPVVAVASVAIAMIINAVVLYESRSGTGQPSQEGEQQFATEYNLADNTIYDSTIDPE